ncbi:hypothetical protein ACIOK4_34960 [Streptomyces bottropensis]|uniref:hypothetical protein n=1 Tax=Streptomyces bottropensis TaxID=42235 RepID=UPI00381D28D4
MRKRVVRAGGTVRRARRAFGGRSHDPEGAEGGKDYGKEGKSTNHTSNLTIKVERASSPDVSEAVVELTRNPGSNLSDVVDDLPKGRYVFYLKSWYKGDDGPLYRCASAAKCLVGVTDGSLTTPREPESAEDLTQPEARAAPTLCVSHCRWCAHDRTHQCAKTPAGSGSVVVEQFGGVGDLVGPVHPDLEAVGVGAAAYPLPDGVGYVDVTPVERAQDAGDPLRDSFLNPALLSQLHRDRVLEEVVHRHHEFLIFHA